MSNKTRKSIRPGFLVAALGVVAMLAMLAAVMLPSGSVKAQGAFVDTPTNVVAVAADDGSQVTVTWDLSPSIIPASGYEVERKAGTGDFGALDMAHSGTDRTYTDSDVTPGETYTYQVRTNTARNLNSAWVQSNSVMIPDGSGGNGGTTPMAGDVTVYSSSTSGSATVELKLTMKVPAGGVPVGGALVLYLEDDYQEPDSISASDVYFVSTPARVTTGSSARVYATQAPEIDTDDYFTADKDDIDIRVSVPDMCTTDTTACQGNNGLMAGDTVTLVFQKSAGIRNPSEAGSHSVGASILGPTDNVGAPMYQGDTIDIVNGDGEKIGTGELKTLAKISLSDVDNDRGYEMTVTGSGFNNGTSAGVYVLHYPAANNADSATWPTCLMIRDHGTNVGDGIVGSDDKVAVTFEVTAPTFGPGKDNYICMVDGEGLMSDTDVEDFNLQPSIKVVPSSVSSGDTVNVFAQDFPYNAGGDNGFKRVRLARRAIDVISSSSIRPDGSGEATFKVPGGFEGVLRIDAMWGALEDDKKITITGGELSVSKTEALPNETITITGNGFGSQTCIPESQITLDNVPVIVDDESTTVSCDPDRNSATDNSEPGVEVSNSGQFVATVTLWQAEGSANPTLIPGTHELSVEDNTGFGADVSITIPEPTVMVTPDVAGPRDYITIIGDNWPVDNPDNPESVAVQVEVADTTRARTYTLFADASGRVMQEHRVHRNVAIPSTVQVKMSYDVVAEIGSFSVPASTIEVTPGEGQPGDMITLTAGNMPVYSEVDYVEVGGTRSNDPGVNTDRDGNVTVEDVLIPGLDPGLYSVVINVKGTIAIGEVNVLPEGVSGVASALPDAVADFGDNLDAIFHFDNNSKEWSFYDPRPEFAELNTLTELNNGQPYWVLVKADQEDVNWNNRLVDFTCAGGDCWNLEIW